MKVYIFLFFSIIPCLCIASFAGIVKKRGLFGWIFFSLFVVADVFFVYWIERKAFFFTY